MNFSFLENLNELTKKLAYEYWERRGGPWGSPEVDWFAAEKTLASFRGNSQEDFSLLSVRVEPDEGPSR